MITLKNNKLPKLHLKLKGYKIASDNENVREYRKTIQLKDKYNYPEIFYIHIFYHKKDNLSDVCVSRQFYSQDEKDWRYNWYSAKYEMYALDYIVAFDKSLLKYIEKLENEKKISYSKKCDN